MITGEERLKSVSDNEFLRREQADDQGEGDTSAQSGYKSGYMDIRRTHFPLVHNADSPT